MTPEICARALADLDLPAPPAETRVVVAMSGGVDSSVAAALLSHAGYDVVGITLQLYDHGAALDRVGACCAGRDVEDARRVAARLAIPHYVLDYESRFKEQVIEDFADSYLRGETPVPCVRCNQSVKFADLLATARELGAQALITGHYIAARKAGARRAMFRAADEHRDQSYFLFATTQDQLDFLRFPLGALTKPEVRRLAADIGLDVAEKPDSQDICFVPEGRYGAVIERLRPEAGEPGDIVDLEGRVLGRHRGIVHYTIGQRRGLGLAAPDPLYVVALEPEARRVVVGPREALREHLIGLREVNWLGEGAFEDVAATGMELYARIRSTRPPAPARLGIRNGNVEVELIDGDDGISPGQACVFYDAPGAGARVLGGGWIESTARTASRHRDAGNRAAKRLAPERPMRQFSNSVGGHDGPPRKSGAGVHGSAG